MPGSLSIPLLLRKEKIPTDDFIVLVNVADPLLLTSLAKNSIPLENICLTVLTGKSLLQAMLASGIDCCSREAPPPILWIYRSSMSANNIGTSEFHNFISFL
jgi:hypothetical protein